MSFGLNVSLRPYLPVSRVAPARAKGARAVSPISLAGAGRSFYNRSSTRPIHFLRPQSPASPVRASHFFRSLAVRDARTHSLTGTGNSGVSSLIQGAKFMASADPALDSGMPQFDGLAFIPEGTYVHWDGTEKREPAFYAGKTVRTVGDALLVLRELYRRNRSWVLPVRDPQTGLYFIKARGSSPAPQDMKDVEMFLPGGVEEAQLVEHPPYRLNNPEIWIRKARMGRIKSTPRGLEVDISRKFGIDFMGEDQPAISWSVIDETSALQVDNQVRSDQERDLLEPRHMLSLSQVLRLFRGPSGRNDYSSTDGTFDAEMRRRMKSTRPVQETGQPWPGVHAGKNVLEWAVAPGGKWARLGASWINHGDPEEGLDADPDFREFTKSFIYRKPYCCIDILSPDRPDGTTGARSGARLRARRPH